MCLQRCILINPGRRPLTGPPVSKPLKCLHYEKNCLRSYYGNPFAVCYQSGKRDIFPNRLQAANPGGVLEAQVTKAPEIPGYCTCILVLSACTVTITAGRGWFPDRLQITLKFFHYEQIPNYCSDPVACYVEGLLWPFIVRAGDAPGSPGLSGGPEFFRHPGHGFIPGGIEKQDGGGGALSSLLNP